MNMPHTFIVIMVSIFYGFLFSLFIHSHLHIITCVLSLCRVSSRSPLCASSKNDHDDEDPAVDRIIARSGIALLDLVHSFTCSSRRASGKKHREEKERWWTRAWLGGEGTSLSHSQPKGSESVTSSGVRGRTPHSTGRRRRMPSLSDSD